MHLRHFSGLKKFKPKSWTTSYLEVLVLQLELTVVEDVQVLKRQILDFTIVPKLIQQGPVDVLQRVEVG
jgi:hypothetical protein